VARRPLATALALAATLLLGCPAPGAKGARRGTARAAADRAPAEAGSGTTRVYYRYVDASGAIRFVESAEQVPAAQRPGSRLEWQAPARAAAPAPSARERLDGLRRALAERGTAAGEPAAARGAPRAEVVVYTTSWCPWCRKALAHLDRHGVAYENRDIERDREALDELRRKTGSHAVPVLEIDGELVRGFDRPRIDELLGL
jgi:glutaredoxin-like YruB-family protein